jgi:hypothetical protein
MPDTPKRPVGRPRSDVPTLHPRSLLTYLSDCTDDPREAMFRCACGSLVRLRRSNACQRISCGCARVAAARSVAKARRKK